MSSAGSSTAPSVETMSSVAASAVSRPSTARLLEAAHLARWSGVSSLAAAQRAARHEDSGASAAPGSTLLLSV